MWSHLPTSCWPQISPWKPSLLVKGWNIMDTHSPRSLILWMYKQAQRREEIFLKSHCGTESVLIPAWEKYCFLNVEASIGGCIISIEIPFCPHSFCRKLGPICWSMTTHLGELERHIPFLMAQYHDHFAEVAIDLLSKLILELTLIFKVFSLCTWEVFKYVYWNKKAFLYLLVCFP